MSQDIGSSWVSTEVDYTIPIDDKQTKSEFKMMRKIQKYVMDKQVGNYKQKRNEGLNKQFFDLKKS